MRTIEQLAIGLRKEKTAAHTKEILSRLSSMARAGKGGDRGILSRGAGLGKYLLMGLLFSGGAAAAGAMGHGIDQAWTRRKGYQNMLKSNPEMAGKEEELKPLFKTMTHFSPQVAKDPLAAGSMLKRMHEFREVGVPLSDIASLAKIEKDVKGSRGISSGFGKGTDKVLQDMFLVGAGS